jgi:uncharacterized protein
MSPNGAEQPEEFRIFCVDGGGIRGLISALVTAKIEQLLRERDGDAARIADYFHLFAGTSTGGLIALALTRPEPPSADELAGFYTEDGPKIFDRSLMQELGSGWGTLAPKYDNGPLREAVRRRLGDGHLGKATKDLLVTSYDMTNAQPFFFKRWKALENPDWDFSIVDAALSTAAAPTYFPCHEPEKLKGHALVDGGVFAGNPTIAAIAEALGRSSDPPAGLDLKDMLVVSIGTGEFSTGFPPEVRGWGDLGWIAGGGADPPILSAMLGGSSDGADYWAHMLLNHERGKGLPEAAEIGRGDRYFRFQAPLAEAIQMDDASPETLQLLTEAAEELIEKRGAEIAQIVDGLTKL